MSEEIHEEKSVTITQAILIVITVVVVLCAAGYFVGKQFFWDQYDTTPLHERQLEALEAFAKENPDSNNAKVLLFDKYFGSGNNAEARKVLDELKKDLNDNPDIMYREAVLLQAEGKVDEALGIIAMVVEAKPLFPYARVIYSQLLTDKQEYDKAIEEMNMALKIMPVAADLRLELAKIYLAKGDKEKALENVDKVLSMVPDYEEALEFKKQIN